MAETARQICQQALLRLGFGAPGSFSSTSDATGRQIWALLGQVDRDVKTRHDWQQMRRQITFTTVAGEAQFNLSTDIPDGDFMKFVNQTMFNRSQEYPVLGPLTAAQWQRRKATAVGDLHYYFTVRSNELLFLPEANAGEEIAFEYYSNAFWVDANGNPLAVPGNDSDKPVLDCELYILGLMWRWLKSKGLEYAEALRDYEYFADSFAGATDPAPVLGLSGTATGLPDPHLPDGGWT